MRQLSRLSFFNALPPYLGGKRRLIPWLFKHLAKVIPASEWSSLTFMDGFLGGGAVSLFAKAQGFQTVLANDWSARSQIIGKALLQNQSTQLSKEEVLQLTHPSKTHWIAEIYAPEVFSKRHAQALGGALEWIEQIHEPTKEALYQLLLWHLMLDFVCFPTSLGSSNRPYAQAMDGLKDWDRLPPKRFTDGSLKTLLRPAWHRLEALRKRVNQGVFSGTPVQLFQQDTAEFITQVQGDIAYFDPPYAGTVSYEKSNALLDQILFNQPVKLGSSVSTFSKDVGALDDLLEQAKHIPIWMISYGNRTVTLADLVKRIQRHQPHRKIIVESRAYKHLSHVSKNADNQEFLVIASLKDRRTPSCR